MNINIFEDDFAKETGGGNDIFMLNKQFSKSLSVLSDSSDHDSDLTGSTETIEFFDYDVLNFLNYIIDEKHCKDFLQTGNIVIQMIRYKMRKDITLNNGESIDSVLNIIELFSDKVKKLLINDEQRTNLVTRSYWLGVVNYIFFKLYKESDYHFFKLVPAALEKIVDLLKFLMITIVDSINEQITDELIVNNMLYFYDDESDFAATNNAEGTELRYKDESAWTWKHAKKNKLLLSNNQTNRKSLDGENSVPHGILPPPVEEQVNSPIKICHVLNSLVYVLANNNVSQIIQKQLIVFTLMQILNKTFNNLIADDFIKTRDRAIKIKLNLLMIQDWCKEEDSKSPLKIEFLDEIDEYILDTYPYNLLPDNYTELKNVYSFAEQGNFLYKSSLKNIFDKQSIRLNDLLELLTIMSNFNDKETHKADFTNFVEGLNLNKQQILKIVNAYRYEVNEPSFRFKKLIEKDVVKPRDSKENGLLLSVVAFKNITKILIPFTKEMIPQYSHIKESVDQFYKNDLDDIHSANLKKYGPPTNLTMDIRKPEVTKKAASETEFVYQETDDNVEQIDEIEEPDFLNKAASDEEPGFPQPALGDFVDDNPW